MTETAPPSSNDLTDASTPVDVRDTLASPELLSPDHTKRNNRVIALLLGATFVVILNEMIMTVAIPRLMEDLRVDAVAAQWLSTAFMLTMAVVIPITGFLLQRFSTRAMFIAAMSLFSLGTLAAGLSPGFPVLVVARVIQASGTAIMVPLLMTTLMMLVPANKRGRMMGNVSIVISVAPAIGPTVAGLILHFLDWRWIFFCVLPIALIMLLIGAKFIENVTKHVSIRIDVVSVILAAFGFGGLVYSLSQLGVPASEVTGDAALLQWSSLAVGVIALIVFVVRQIFLQKKERALLDLRTFRSPIFTVGMVIMALTVAVFFGSLLVLSLFLQDTLKLGTLETGLLLLPGGLIMGLVAPLIGRLYDKFGPRVLVVPGAVICSAALWALATVTAGTSPFFVLAAHITLSIGLALIFTPLFTASLGAIPARLYSHGSAMIGTIQQVAGAAGTAMLIGVMSLHTATLVSNGVSPQSASAGGVSLAFVVAAALSLLAIVGSLFVRKPAETIEDGAVHH